MRRTLGLILAMAIGVAGLTACMSDDERSTAAFSVATAAGSTPWQYAATRTLSDGATSSAISFTVPAGKVLVIEYVSMSITVQSGQDPFLASLHTTAGGSAGTSYLPRFEPRAVSGRFFAAEHLTRYADAGSTVSLNFSRHPDSSGLASFYSLLSGYLVDEPADPG